MSHNTLDCEDMVDLKNHEQRVRTCGAEVLTTAGIGQLGRLANQIYPQHFKKSPVCISTRHQSRSSWRFDKHGFVITDRANVGPLINGL